MKYYVISRYYDKGKVTAELLLESEYTGQQPEYNETFTQYVDTFPTRHAADKFLKDSLK